MPSWFRENVSALQAKEVSAVLSSNFIYGAMLTHRKHPAPLNIPPAPRTGLWFASTASVPPCWAAHPLLGEVGGRRSRGTRCRPSGL